MDPDRDPRFIATGRAALAAMTCGQIDLLTSTPPGCRTPGASLIVRHPGGVAGSFVTPSHGSSGLTPLDLWLGSGHPGGVPPRRQAHCLIGRRDDLSDGSAGAPRRGCLFHSPGVEARSADDPGLPAIHPIDPTPLGVEGIFRLSYPGVVGANAPPTPGL